MQSKPLRILLIEHDPASARVIGDLIQSVPDSVASLTVADSLVEAVARLNGTEFDVVAMEFFLPDGAGLANIAMLKSASPRVPIIAVGAEDDESIAVEAVHAGAQD